MTTATKWKFSKLLKNPGLHCNNNKSRLVYLMKYNLTAPQASVAESQMLIVTIFLQLCNMPIKASILKLYFCQY